MPLHVSSEIGQLRSVLVHSPGPELLAVTPDTREDYLYDDIVDVQTAGREHADFVRILQRFSQVHYVGDLLRDGLDTSEARTLFVRETMDVVPSEPLARELEQLPADTLSRVLIEGRD